ncbi:MAG TPA: cbb3-type cytochrome oxidase assembly protein CcoS [Candidatus Xenobia bacterium]|jgi:cbb3-type cytochrome oxidase maturation protein
MNILYFLIPLALGLSGLGLGLFTWAVQHSQFDDLEGPRWRVLEEDQP